VDGSFLEICSVRECMKVLIMAPKSSSNTNVALHRALECAWPPAWLKSLLS